MAFAEESGPGQNEFDFGFGDCSSLDVILPRVIHRHNELVIAANKVNLVLPWTEVTHDSPTLIAQAYGNEFVVQAVGTETKSTSFIKVGFFSATKNSVVLFPELVEPDEAPLMNMAALQDRWLMIDKFEEAAANCSRIDYEDPDVRALHTQHDLRLGAGLLQRLLDAYNEDIDTKLYSNPTYIEADNFTDAAISVHSMPNRPDCFIGLRLLGALEVANGVRRRIAHASMPLTKNPEDPNCMETFEPKFETLRLDDVEQAVNISHTVTDLRLMLRGPNGEQVFDPVQLGKRVTAKKAN